LRFLCSPFALRAHRGGTVYEKDKPMTASSTYLTELDHRDNHGISVSLFWNRTANALSVSLDDGKTGEAFSVPVSCVEAHEVFIHPFAYAHRAGS
jgi:hypothetical protein